MASMTMKETQTQRPFLLGELIVQNLTCYYTFQNLTCYESFRILPVQTVSFIILEYFKGPEQFFRDPDPETVSFRNCQTIDDIRETHCPGEEDDQGPQGQ